MRLLKRLLYEPKYMKNDKVTDKALTRSVVISAIGILFCLTCLFGLTWAWFSDSVIVGSNKITAANFDLDITVTEQGTGNAVMVGDDGYFTLDAATTYTVSLAKQGTAKTGFCLLSVKRTPDDETSTPYYTGNIPQKTETPEEEKTETDPFIFTVSGVTKIKFTAMLGECPEEQADKAIQYNGALDITSPVKSAAPTPSENDEDDTTTDPEVTYEPETETEPETTYEPETDPGTTYEPEPVTEPESETTEPETTTEPVATEPETTESETTEPETTDPPVTDLPEPTEPKAPPEQTEP